MQQHPPVGTSGHRNGAGLLTPALLLVLFILLAWLSTRLPYTIDLTRGARHTVSTPGIAVLNGIQGPVNIVSYAREQPDLRLGIERFIGRFRRIKPDITLEFRNPDAVPDEVRRLGVRINGELVISHGGRTAHVQQADEQAFINALIRLTRADEKWIAFIDGHGERNPLGEANHDLGEWGTQLVNRGWRIRPLNLAATGVIPDNTAVLVLAGPRTAFLPGETAQLLDYLQRGGNLLWLLDPGNEQPLPELAAHLGIVIEPGSVLDAGGKLIGIDDPAITLLTESLYPPHPLLDQFTQTTLFPGAAALRLPEDGDWNITPLLTTATHTWLERGTIDANSRFDDDADLQGPLTIAAVGERGRNDAGTGQRIVVVADGDFLSNRYLGNGGNLDLGLRMINWLGGEDELLTIPSPPVSDSTLEASPVVVGVFGLFFLVLMPLLLVATGLGIWWRRKRS